MNAKKQGGRAALIVLLIIIIIIAGALLAMKILNKNIETSSINSNEENIDITEPIVEEKPEINIYNGNERPIAVMIDNVGDARPQVGLNEAYIVYEIIVEGAQTRLMALFKGKDLEEIGPVRSSRHYFLDYALENDAIYVHYGWSPKAKSDISTLGVNNINGITESSKSFWRITSKSAPHNVLTSTENILSIAERKSYRTTSEEESILNYTTDEVNLENDSSQALEINIPYSTSYEVIYKYNEETKKYERYCNETLQKDLTTKEVIETKNIIITFAENTTLNDGSGKGRQDLNNIGDLEGYYITNGKAIEIICSKKSRTGKTIYKDLEGNTINVNDGNTFIQICPINAKVEIK